MQVSVRQRNINCGITKLQKHLTSQKIKMLFAGTAETKMNRRVRHREHKGKASTIRDKLFSFLEKIYSVVWMKRMCKTRNE